MRRLLVTLAIVTLFLWSISAGAENFAFGFSGFTPTNNLNIDGSPYLNTDSGWINSNGVHQAGNTNYYSGFFDCGGIGVCKNFFSFDLTPLTSKRVNAATFTVFTYAISVPGIYSIFGTNLDPADVNSANGYTSIPFYSRLTAGPLIGFINLTPGMSYTDATITLDHQGLIWLKNHEGGGAVIGGEFTPIPEPGTLVLLGSGALGLAGILRRNKLML
jgi:PEP-CTERM motif-containing protein